MPALYPVSVAAEDYKVGDNVKWFSSSTDVSPYVGRVVAISPKIHKVWVTWPIGETQQMAPEELILVTPAQGLSVVPGDNGYDSIDKQMSAKYFGTAAPVNRDALVVKLASQFQGFVGMVSKKASAQKAEETFLKSASDMMAKQASDGKATGKTSMQVYASLFDTYGASIPDSAIKAVVLGVYGQG
jgi:hypothetical protein